MRLHFLGGKNSRSAELLIYGGMVQRTLKVFFCHPRNFQKPNEHRVSRFTLRNFLQFTSMKASYRCFLYSCLVYRKKLSSFVPCRYPKEQQAILVQNVFLTGGNAMYPGLKARVQKELLEMRPFQSSFQVRVLTDEQTSQKHHVLKSVPVSERYGVSVLRAWDGECSMTRHMTAALTQRMMVKQRYS